MNIFPFPYLKKPQYLSQFFDAVYVINLPERTRRMRKAQKELKKLGLSHFTRFNAIRPSFEAIPESYYSEMSVAPNASGWKSYITGSCGCKLSHLGVIEQAKKDNAKRILIFEDDIRVLWRKLSLFDYALQELPEKWDMIYFGGNPLVDPVPYHNNLSRITKMYSSFAYGLNMSIADQILDGASHSGSEIDVFYADHIQPEGYCFITNPRLISIHPGWSDILNEQVNYDCVLLDT